MPRLFTGIEIPQTQKTLLAMLQSGLGDARWIAPEDLHITLRFIGDVSPKQADAIADALSKARWRSPNIAFGELRAFGGTKPRSVYASVKEDKVLTRLQAAQEVLMQKLGLPAEARKFTPHATLARSNRFTPEKVAHYLGQFGGFSAPDYQATSFVLYSARDSVGGGPYHVEERFPLFPSEQQEQNNGHKIV